MIGKLDKSPQLDIFKVPLKQRIPANNELARLAGKIHWDRMADQLSIHYSPDKGRKSIPVRKMAGLLILKSIFGGSDNHILKGWLDKPEFQYFCGEVYYQEKALFSRSDLVSFRKRIGEKGMGIVFYPELWIMLEKIKDSLEKQTKGKYSRNIFHLIRQLFHSKHALKPV